MNNVEKENALDSGSRSDLYAPLSGGVVQISKGTIQEYVEGIKRSTGILVARISA